MSKRLLSPLFQGSLFCLVFAAASPAVFAQAATSADDHAAMARSLASAHRLDDAAAEAGAAIALQPNNPQYYLLRSQIYMAAGRMMRAQDDVTAVIKLTPSDPNAYFRRALMVTHPPMPTVYDDLTALRAGTNADPFSRNRIADLNEAIRLNPQFGDAYCSRAGEYMQYRGLAGYEQALADFNKGLENGCHLPLYLQYWMRGQLQALIKGDQLKAVADYTEALRQNPQAPIVCAMRAASYQVLGKLDDALSDYSLAIQLDPKYGFAYLHRAEIYERKGDFTGAEADRSQAKLLPCEPYALRPGLK
jgi:tetratricopeptide (TPR) repeat protein